jgi:UDP-glucose 4-epimerase
MCAAALAPWTGVANIGSGRRTSMNDAVRILRGLGERVDVLYMPARPGEGRHYAADTAVARKVFGFEPTIPLVAGLTRTLAASHAR